jgi:serine/threonine protein kinase/tetratricopeptide (TPR) repeat protein
MKDSSQLLLIFCEARERPSDKERAAYLDQACGGDDDLRSRVEALLQAEPKIGNFLRGDLSPENLAASAEAPVTECPGTVIGPYKLLEQIGEGGFGVVFMAEQTQPIRRKVALKVLKPGMDTRQVIARFGAERQALALMDHPNIAHILDGGETASGRPYFVMELVRGIPITEFCDQNHLPVRERLELFISVCQAVQHAHQKGVIHRDLKPSNMLVTLHDDKAVVKVIDFGIAKAMGQQLTEKTLFTNFAQMVGTPMYMSPEQAQMSGLDVDTRCDVYALGVLLYELLTGTTPFDKERLKTMGYDEIRRVIREEEPARPSTRISTLGLAATTLSIHRKSDPKRSSQSIRGELDWIVMKCLEKDRNRRYETASALGRDIDRYLHDEPVQACPPSACYRLRKFARKYRAILQIAGVFVVLLVAAAAVSTWQAVRATRERDRAEASFRMARDAVDRLFTEVSQSPKLKTQSMEKFRKDLLQNAREFYERFIREQFDAPAVRYDLGLAQHRLAEIHRELGDYAAAEDSMTKAIAVLDELVHAQPAMAEYQRDLAASYSALGLVYSNTAGWEQADAAYQQAMAIQEKQAVANPEVPERRYELAKTCSALGLVKQWSGSPEQAATMSEQAQGILSKLVEDHPNVSEYRSLLAATQMNLGQVYDMQGWYEKAVTAFKEAQGIYGRLVQGRPDSLPEDRQSLARSHALLGMAYNQTNDNEKAEQEQQQALHIFERLAQEHPDVLEYAYDLGRCHMALGRTADRRGRSEVALGEYAKTIEIMKGAIDKGYLKARIQLLSARIGRASVLAGQGDHARATEEAESVVREENPNFNLYNTACIFSRASAMAERDTKLSAADRGRLGARYADRAMDYLRQAVAKGFRHPHKIKEDRDLGPLRAREDFRKLLADLEANNPDSK